VANLGYPDLVNPRKGAPLGRFVGLSLAALGVDATVLWAAFSSTRQSSVGPFPAALPWLAAAALALSVGAVALPTVVMLRANRSLTELAREWAGGDLAGRASTSGLAGLRGLADALNQMAASLQRREETSRLREAELVGQTERLATTARLAAGVAHELNNPLGGILLYGNLLVESTPVDDPRHENMTRIVKQATRARDIVRGLLDFARVSPAEISVLDLNQLVRDTLKLLEKQLQAIQVRTEQSTVELLVRADAGRLQQVLVNIILNALDAMRDGGLLTIRTGYSEKPGFCRVAITDTGCGIREDHLPHLFEPFFTTKEVGRGVGLGLAISYGIVRQHGGDIEVQSQVGAGTTFRVMLPAAEEA
jgi:two-component system NtrC family sensor kinase